ncbi:RNI-like protein [Ascoidea rubescens DSM 1968]|uniref:RNI-like protein n=1 Tax=Ascoidea rubescens DSM 1968 TaxID=1344418 RepID=A0A1D2V915_9ASCO|nr:RNI-like protein [Ascoidea rubescens DSM 1968]ODV57995.1 RNI-like protein [Ascoidea rubescens DSM 1968]
MKSSNPIIGLVEQVAERKLDFLEIDLILNSTLDDKIGGVFSSEISLSDAQRQQIYLQKVSSTDSDSKREQAGNSAKAVLKKPSSSTSSFISDSKVEDASIDSSEDDKSESSNNTTILSKLQRKFSRKSKVRPKLQKSLRNPSISRPSSLSLSTNISSNEFSNYSFDAVKDLNARANHLNSKQLQNGTKELNLLDNRLEVFLKSHNYSIPNQVGDLLLASGLQQASEISTGVSKVDVLGRPIPSHPSKSVLPPALKLSNDSNPESPQPRSIVGSFLHRRHSASTTNKRVEKKGNLLFLLSVESLPGYEVLPDFKRVSFGGDIFLNDPPQQIPSRHPRTGEVEVLKTGEKIIHKLSAEEKNRLTHSGGGIVVGGSGRLLSNTSLSSTENVIRDPENIDESGLSNTLAQVSIDKPMIRHNRPSSDANSGKLLNKVSLDILYTRCCHLREILPIPATLKQLPSGSCNKIKILKFKNAQPSLIEVLTFADFISIAPIECISLDGVSFSYEMFKILLSSLHFKSDLRKLSLRNTIIDLSGWKLLCWLLMKNKFIQSLDLTLSEFLTVFSNRKKKKNQNALNVTRMTQIEFGRPSMDWSLFVATLIYRGGIEELMVNGCSIGCFPVFKNLFQYALTPKLKYLGFSLVSLSDLMTVEFCNWLSLHLFHLESLDFGYNSFLTIQSSHPSNSSSHQILELKTLIHFNIALLKVLENKDNFKIRLKYLSLNSVVNLFLNNNRNELSDCGEVFPKSEIIKLMFYLSQLPMLEYFDFSNNPGFFNHYFDIFVNLLSSFKSLYRVDLNFNNFSQEQILTLCEFVPFFTKVGWISLFGNNIENWVVSSLVKNMNLSLSFFGTFFEYQNISTTLRKLLASHLLSKINRAHKSFNQGFQDMIEALSPSNLSAYIPMTISSSTKKIHSYFDQVFTTSLDLPFILGRYFSLNDLKNVEESNCSLESHNFNDLLKNITDRYRGFLSELLVLYFKDELDDFGIKIFIKLFLMYISLMRAAKILEKLKYQPELNKDLIAIYTTIFISIPGASIPKASTKLPLVKIVQNPMENGDGIKEAANHNLIFCSHSNIKEILFHSQNIGIIGYILGLSLENGDPLFSIFRMKNKSEKLSSDLLYKSIVDKFIVMKNGGSP